MGERDGPMKNEIRDVCSTAGKNNIRDVCSTADWTNEKRHQRCM